MATWRSCTGPKGKLPEALRLAQRAVKAAQDLGQAGQGRLLFTLQTVAGIHRSAGRFDEAATLYRLALEKSIAQNGERHPATAAIQNNLADLEVKLAHYGAAERLARQAIAAWQGFARAVTSARRPRPGPTWHRHCACRAASKTRNASMNARWKSSRVPGRLQLPIAPDGVLEISPT